jgi:hypothetical protein
LSSTCAHRFSLKLPYGRDEARIFLNELVPAAPDVVIQIAHMAGGGAPGDQLALQALEVLAEAVAKGEPRTKLLYFDASGMNAQIAVAGRGRGAVDSHAADWRAGGSCSGPTARRVEMRLRGRHGQRSARCR